MHGSMVGNTARVVLRVRVSRRFDFCQRPPSNSLDNAAYFFQRRLAGNSLEDAVL